jgi:tRNA/rRNA methyltransferase
MKNMACYDLRITGRKEDFSDEQVRTLAVHAADIWETATFYEPTIDGLKAAIADCSIAAGTTRRMGIKRKSWGMTPEQFVRQIHDTGERKSAIVFGNERTGLTDEELDCCTIAVNIPSHEAFPSLNLSHAVQLMTYSLYREYDEKHRGYEPISIGRIKKLVGSVSDDLDRVGLFRNMGQDSNDRFLESVFTRAALSEREAQRLEKMFKKIAYIKTESDQDK